MLEKPQRKINRLKDYDYSQENLYFVTLCIKNRESILGNIVGANCVRPQLFEIGIIVENEIKKLGNIYENINITEYIIMPNHIHAIIEIGRTQFAPTLSRIIKQFKGSITKQIGYSIWQKSYYDHIIRNEKELYKIIEYIKYNSLNWENDSNYNI